MTVRGYPIAAEALDLELYRLLSLIAASRAIHRSRRQWPALDRLRNAFEPCELSLRLISVAVAVRNLMDTSLIGPAHAQAPVGLLTRNCSGRQDQSDLTFREACNKIIHADEVELYSGAGNGSRPVQPRIRLHGARRRETWVAQVDPHAFITETFEFV